MKGILNLGLVFPLLFFVYGCDDSEDDNSTVVVRTEINNESILTADVNAEDFWDNDELIWSDEFNGNNLTFENWVFEASSVVPGNTEWQTYTKDDNFEVSDGTLKIFARKTGEGQKRGDYTSARLGSTFAFTYGRMEIRAKMPEEKGNGIWAKLWLLGDAIQTVDWPESGEMDLAEYVSNKPNQVYATIHSASNNIGNNNLITSGLLPLETAEEQFHNYGLLWTDAYLKFYIDDIDNVILTFSKPENPNSSNWPFSKPFYFLMNMVVGGNVAGAEGVDDTIFPSVLEVDYVRVYHPR